MFPARRKGSRCRLKPDDDRQGKHYFPFIAERNSFRELSAESTSRKRPAFASVGLSENLQRVFGAAKGHESRLSSASCRAVAIYDLMQGGPPQDASVDSRMTANLGVQGLCLAVFLFFGGVEGGASSPN